MKWRTFIAGWKRVPAGRAAAFSSAISEDTKRFIDRHVTPGEKWPPAPSLRRAADHALRVGGRKTGA